MSNEQHKSKDTEGGHLQHIITKEPSISRRRDKNAWCCCSGVKGSA